MKIEKAYFLNAGGQYNEIVVVNDDLIFRFPRFEEGVVTLQTELAILSKIHAQLAVPAPNPIYVNLELKNPAQSFMGYQMLPGRPFTRPQLAQLPQSATQQLGQQLGRILKALHAIPTDIFDVELPAQDGIEEWKALFSEFKAHLFSHMRADAREEVAAHFNQFLAFPELHAYTPCLRHGDFGVGNILVDDEWSVTAVIDFGFAGLGDPAIDIAASLTLGDSLFTALNSVYQADDLMLKRAQFYRGTYALMEALYGIKHDDTEAFQSGIKEYI
ncbi:MAG: aminoglycoside phosphotransferase family protein [Chloroflexota bacterium]